MYRLYSNSIILYYRIWYFLSVLFLPELTKVDNDALVGSEVAIDVISKFVTDVDMGDVTVGVVVDAMSVVLIIGGLLYISELVDWDIESVGERVVVLSILLAAVRYWMFYFKNKMKLGNILPKVI